jgi:hypothetical protein
MALTGRLGALSWQQKIKLIIWMAKILVNGNLAFNGRSKNRKSLAHQQPLVSEKAELLTLENIEQNPFQNMVISLVDSRAQNWQGLPHQVQVATDGFTRSGHIFFWLQQP